MQPHLKTSSPAQAKSICEVVGPGAYSVPQLMGTKPVESILPSCPMYSFNKVNDRGKGNTHFISREHNRHILPDDVPGVGLYEPNKLRLVKKVPSIAPQHAKRFASASRLMSFKASM